MNILERYVDYMTLPTDPAPLIEQPNLRTGVGHGHPRAINRERSPKDVLAKRRKKTKTSKASRKKNRK